MVAILGTLGFHPESLIPTIKSCEDVTHIAVFISPHANSKTAAAKVRQFCEALEIELDVITIPDAFDLLKIAECIQDVVLKLREQGHEIAVFNIAGGTRVMSAGALLVCIIEGLNSVYVHDDTGAEIPLPSLHLRYSSALTEMERQVLMFVTSNPDHELSQKDIAEGMSLHKATVNHHIRMLLEKGAVHLVPKKGDKRIKVVKADESMRLLLR